MSKYLARACPRCSGYLGIVLRAPERTTGVRAICGHCFRCHHRLLWRLIKGKVLFPSNVQEKGHFTSTQTSPADIAAPLSF
jgi:hypothetical protein